MPRMSKRTASNEGSQDAPKKMKSTIFMRRMVEEVFPVEIDLSAPVKTLKEEIQKQKGIGMENQLVDFAGVSLKDDQPLRVYGIQDSSYLHVMEKTRSRGWITIFVKTPKETFPISLCAQSRLLNLQQKLFDLLGVDVTQQRIMFDGKLQTDRSEKLETFGHGSTVELHLPRFTNVQVRSERNISDIRIEDFDTGHSVKMTIFRLWHVIPSAQRILINDVQVEDEVLMREYKLTEHSILEFYENTDAGIAIDVIVKLPSEKEIKVKTDRLKSVYSLMQHIEETEGIPITTQYLYLKERQLLEWKSLGESGVTNGGKINLFLTSTKTEIFVVDAIGQSYTLHVDLNDSVYKVNVKLASKTGMPVYVQRLFLKNKRLEGETLLDCGVEKGSTLQLLKGQCGC